MPAAYARYDRILLRVVIVLDLYTGIPGVGATIGPRT